MNGAAIARTASAAVVFPLVVRFATAHGARCSICFVLRLVADVVVADALPMFARRRPLAKKRHEGVRIDSWISILNASPPVPRPKITV